MVAYALCNDGSEAFEAFIGIFINSTSLFVFSAPMFATPATICLTLLWWSHWAIYQLEVEILRNLLRASNSLQVTTASPLYFTYTATLNKSLYCNKQLTKTIPVVEAQTWTQRVRVG